LKKQQETGSSVEYLEVAVDGQRWTGDCRSARNILHDWSCCQRKTGTSCALFLHVL